MRRTPARLPAVLGLLVIFAAFGPAVAADPPDTTVADAAFHDVETHDAHQAAVHCAQTLARARRPAVGWSSSFPVGVVALLDPPAVPFVDSTSSQTRAPPVA